MGWLILILILISIVVLITQQDKLVGKKITYKDQYGQKQTEKLERRKPREILLLEKPEIELSAEIQTILDIMENTKSNVFITGKAGTGKSTLLRYFRATTSKNHAVVAPTGIAAINVQGQTIHSFFGFGIDITPERVKFANGQKLNIMRNLDTLIIDEISMVRADLLDCIDTSLRKNRRSNAPFGGVQVIAIGDPYQLPPIVQTAEYKFFRTVYKSPHFFSANSFQRGNFVTFELSKIYRQSDLEFIQILNNIRNGSVTIEEIDELNERTKLQVPTNESIKLVTTNSLARYINTAELAKIPSTGKLYKGSIHGDFKEDFIPTELELNLKKGARVMLLNNEANRRWVNGDVGTLIELGEGSVKVKFSDNTFDDIPMNQWDNVMFVFDEEKRKIVPEIVGKFIQLPIKLAWAVTIHKSQGMTYNKVHVDFGTGTFAPGQAYVALSRCTSLEGLTFETPMQHADVIVDTDVNAFMEKHPKDSAQSKIASITNISPSSTNQLEQTVNKLTKPSVTQSDINKLKFFIEYPERYATGTSKSKEKVESVKRTFELVKDSLDVDLVEAYYDALDKYSTKLKASA